MLAEEYVYNLKNHVDLLVACIGMLACSSLRFIKVRADSLLNFEYNKEESLRVLYVDHTAKIGGGEIALLNLVRNIDVAYVDPVVLLFSEGPLVQRLQPGTQTHILPLPAVVGQAKKDALGLSSILRLKEIWFTLCHIFKVAAFIRSINADIVHTNSLKADIIGGVAARLAGIPVIWHVRDRIDADYLPRMVVFAFRFLSRKIPNYVIANSEATLSTLHLSGKSNGTNNSLETVPNTRSGVVHDGCTLNAMRISDTAVTGVCRIGLVGRISPWKGQDIFLHAAAEVLKRQPAIRFEIIGAPLFAEREFEESLHMLCRSLKIEHAVDFVGFVDDVTTRIAQLSVLVHASTTGEPFGQVIIEAMAEGKPVVATNGGGVPEIVQDGVTGLLVPMGDSYRMSEAIVWLLDHPAEASSMGRAGRERVKEKFTIQKTARMVQAVYQQVLEKG